MEAQAGLGDELVNIQTDGIWSRGLLEVSDELGDYSIEAECKSLLSIRGNVYCPFNGDGDPILSNAKFHAYQGPRSKFLDCLRDGGYYTDKWVKRFEAKKGLRRVNSSYRKWFGFDWQKVDYKTSFADIKGVNELLNEVKKGDPFEMRGGILYHP